MTTRRITYLNDAGKPAAPTAQLHCQLCPNALLILAHQNPVAMAKAMNWTSVDNVPLDPDKPGLVRSVWICHEHTIVHRQEPDDVVVARHPAAVGGRGR